MNSEDLDKLKSALTSSKDGSAFALIDRAVLLELVALAQVGIDANEREAAAMARDAELEAQIIEWIKNPPKPTPALEEAFKLHDELLRRRKARHD